MIATEQAMGIEVNPRLLDWLRCNTPGHWHAENAALLENGLPSAAWRP